MKMAKSASQNKTNSYNLLRYSWGFNGALVVTLTFVPTATLSSEYFEESHGTSSFGNMRFVTSVPGNVES